MKSFKNYYPPYVILSFLYLLFIIFAFFLDSPLEIYQGLKRIIFSSDILITDYMELGGIGAALVNASLTSLLSISLLMINGIKPNGSTIMSLWLMTGFSFLGKNIFNIWPIIFRSLLILKISKGTFS